MFTWMNKLHLRTVVNEPCKGPMIKLSLAVPLLFV